MTPVEILENETATDIGAHAIRPFRVATSDEALAVPKRRIAARRRRRSTQ